MPDATDAGAMPSCTRPQPVVSRAYLAFFDQHSAVLSDRARAIVTAFGADRVGLVAEIEGNVDTSETGLRDRGLGRRRAESVAAVLQQLGTPAERLILKDDGTSRLFVPTPPATPEPQNRRVDLVLLSGYRTVTLREREACVEWLSATYCSANSPTAVACRTALGFLQD